MGRCVREGKEEIKHTLPNTLGSLGPNVKHMAKNDLTGGAREPGYLHTNSDC